MNQREWLLCLACQLMSHAAARLQGGGYKQILAPSPEAEPPPHSHFSSALSRLSFINSRIAQDWLSHPRLCPARGQSQHQTSFLGSSPSAAKAPEIHSSRQERVSEVTRLSLHQQLPEDHFWGWAWRHSEELQGARFYQASLSPAHCSTALSGQGFLSGPLR